MKAELYVGSSRITATKALVQRALEARVTIACGSDAGVFAHGTNARELELLVDYGLSPAHALRAATVTPAGVLGRADLGRVAEGAIADLVAVRGNPLEDVTTLRAPVVVIKAGVVVIDRRTE